MPFTSIVDKDLGPLFQLLDNYDAHRSSYGTRTPSSVRAFRPKFDVRESKDAYELYGELCGVEQDDISIDFADPHTIVIKGRVERDPKARITGEVKGDNHSYHKPTVEDEADDGGNAGTGAVTKTDTQNDTDGDGVKYWVTERSVGEFHRSFSFPSRVDQDAVKASLRNGILSIVIPKAQAPKTRRIQIS
jgi:HSP20 family protein